MFEHFFKPLNIYKFFVVTSIYLRSFFCCANDRFFITNGSSKCKDDRSCQKNNDNTVSNDTSCTGFQFWNYHSRKYNDQSDQAGLQDIWKINIWTSLHLSLRREIIYEGIISLIILLVINLEEIGSSKPSNIPVGFGTWNLDCPMRFSKPTKFTMAMM